MYQHRIDNFVNGIKRSIDCKYNSVQNRLQRHTHIILVISFISVLTETPPRSNRVLFCSHQNEGSSSHSGGGWNNFELELGSDRGIL